jgi:hypothetical protein
MFTTFRTLALAALVIPAPSTQAQSSVTFEGLDADSNGRVSLAEFGRLPGYDGRLENFLELDTTRDAELSRDEWMSGVYDSTGIPRGRSGRSKEDPSRTPPALSRHGPNVPSPRESKSPKDARTTLSDREYRELLTGRGGAEGAKRPSPPARVPHSTSDIPPGERPPPR